MLSIPPAPPAREKKKNLRARYQTDNQKSQAPTQTLEMYADTNTSPYRELFALARHTALFTNGLGNWWYISNIASHRLTPWTFLTSGGGKPCSFPKNRANTLLRSSARLASTSLLQLPDSLPECYSVSIARQALGEAKGRPYKFTQAKRSTLYWEKKRRPAHVREGPPSIAGVYDLLAFPLPFEHYASQKKAWSKATTATMRFLQRASGY